LQILLAASLVLPVIIFTLASWISYNRAFDDANDRLQRTLGIIHEHATKVFETMELSAQYTDAMFESVSDEDIRQAEVYYHARLQGLTEMLPQLRDVFVIDARGRPLVSGTIYPMPKDVDFSEREYFQVQKNNPKAGFYVSDVLDSLAANRRIFLISRRRPSPDGRFRGVMTTAFAPEYFVDYYSRLPAQGQEIAALIRRDGAVLARYPDRLPRQPRLDPDTPFLKAVTADSQSGLFRAVSHADGRDRFFVYRKLPRHDVYAVAGLDRATIVRGWLTAMSSHLIFGIPATLAMFGLSWTALRRTRRASRAFARVQEEVARREVTEQALRQAHKMEAVGRLTGGIAHDFNNLLTAILGNIDMAIRRVAPSEERIQRSLSAARQASDRATLLVQRLLAFSRQHPQELKAVDVNRLVQGMSELLRQTIGEPITIETILAEGVWTIAADPNQLENAILNLAVNSRDAMPEGGKLTIETANVNLDKAFLSRDPAEIIPGAYVAVTITDTGSGMSPQVREQALEPFFTTKATGHGSGLGLSMVYGFVSQSGGHIQIESEVGKGTSVKLYFPQLVDRADLPAWPSIQPTRQANEDKGGQNELILLVEDDEDVNRFAADALRELGYRVESAYDGASALKTFREHPDISLLFTDVVLPGGMSGRQIAEELRKLRPDLKVLFATGYTRDAISREGRVNSDEELLSKPFTPATLGRKVRRVLDA
jgi:two-component system NtrC family sensor kinase